MHATHRGRRPHQEVREGEALYDLTLTLPTGQPVAILGPNGAGKTTFIRMVATLHRARPRHARRQRPRRRARPDGGPPHDRPRRPVGRRRADDDRPGEPRHGGPPVRPGPRRGGGLGQSGSSSRWVWRRPPTARSGPIPAGCDGASTSGRASSARPGCCCSTSRRPGSTRGAATRCGTPSTTWAASGTDIVLTTQYLDEADHLAASIVIIDEGRVIAQGTPDELKSRVGRRHGRAAHGRRRHHAPGSRGAGLARDGRAVDRPGDPPVLARRPRRFEAPADRRPCARRGRGPGGGHRAAAPDTRRGVPRAHRAHDGDGTSGAPTPRRATTTTDEPKEDAA